MVAGPEDVLSFAAGVLARDPSKAFVVKADQNVPYRHVDQVVDALKQAKAEVIYFLSQQETVAGEAVETSAAPGGAG
jgi:biopolymer transport protein ExbD